MLLPAELHPTPVRAFRSDAPDDILSFARDAYARGGVAVATLTEIRGGAARSLGSQMAVAEDGRYCGYVSGGCVEAAVAAEALEALAQGQDRIARYGDGSPFFDIVLPCGGGITVSIHVLRNIEVIQRTLDRIALRTETTLSYSPDSQSISDLEGCKSIGWNASGEFCTVYRPRTRMVVSGNPLESEAVSVVATAAGYEVIDYQGTRTLSGGRVAIDRYTAVVLLHHDLHREYDVLREVLDSDAFYIGALGSTRTHQMRISMLRSIASEDAIRRVKAPIGIFGPARDASSLALSIVADVSASRLASQR